MEIHCNGSVPDWNRTRNRPGNLDPLLTLGYMDNCQVCHGSIEAISILDPLDVGEAYGHIASCYDCVQ